MVHRCKLCHYKNIFCLLHNLKRPLRNHLYRTNIINYISHLIGENITGSPFTVVVAYPPVSAAHSTLTGDTTLKVQQPGHLTVVTNDQQGNRVPVGGATLAFVIAGDEEESSSEVSHSLCTS